MPSSILIVDDDDAIRRMLERTLVAEGYEVLVARDGAEALVQCERHAFDALVLDVVMPSPDGLDVARRLRRRGVATPVLFLTARDSVADRVSGLDAGGDDYLVKPFAVEELLARLRALLRRSTSGPLLSAGPLTLDLDARRAVRDGRAVQLTQRESRLLEVLLRHAGRVVGREALRAAVWQDGAAESDNVLDRYISYLRRKLGPPPLIETVRGVGFVLRP